MKIAIVGSRSLNIDIDKFIQAETEPIDEIISGGARGIDIKAREYAIRNNIKLTEIFPEYSKYGRGAPLRRNDLIVQQADLVLIFWDGTSRGSQYVMRKCSELNKKSRVFIFSKEKK